MGQHIRRFSDGHGRLLEGQSFGISNDMNWPSQQRMKRYPGGNSLGKPHRQMSRECIGFYVKESALGRKPWLGTYSVRGHPIALLRLSVHVVEVVCSATCAWRSVLPGVDDSDF